MRSGLSALAAIVSLAAAFAALAAVALFVANELNYDPQIEQKSGVYLIASRISLPNRAAFFPASTPVQLANEVETTLAAPNSTARLLRREITFSREGQLFKENIGVADPAFFDVLSIRLAEGQRATALSHPNSIVVTKSFAVRLFGRSDGVVGQTIEVPGSSPLRVTGVVADAPRNSDFQFTAYRTSVGAGSPMAELEHGDDWIKFPATTFIRPADASADFLKRLSASLEQAAEHHYRETRASGADFRFFIVPVSDLHFRTDIAGARPTRSWNSILALIAIGVLVSLISAMNLSALCAARAFDRVRELRLRHALGATSMELFRVLAAEPLILSLTAATLGTGLSLTALSTFSESLGIASWTGASILSIAIVLLTASASGVFGGFASTLAFYGWRQGGGASLGGAWQMLRKAGTYLLALQFFTTTVAIGVAVTASGQHEYALSVAGGAGEVTVVDGISDLPHPDHAELIADSLAKSPGIMAVTLSSVVPGDANKSLTLIDGLDASGSPRSVALHYVDHRYLKFHEIRVLAGRSFDEERSDATNTGGITRAILSLSAVQALGADQASIVGKTIGLRDRSGLFEIVGIAQDARLGSIWEPPAPVIYISSPSEYRYLLVRARPGRLDDAASAIDKVWADVQHYVPVRREALSTRLANEYDLLATERSVLSLLSLVAGCVSALGLFGLSLLNARTRSREIAIRKSLGATALEVVTTIGIDLLKPVIIGSIIAVPLAVLSAKFYLRRFGTIGGVDVFELTVISVVLCLVSIVAVVAAVLRPASTSPAAVLRAE